MKLRYYLRGLGIGIVVTALIMGIVTADRGAMTDDEIKQRAMELGMVEQKTLISQVQESETPAPEETQSPAEVPTEAPTEAPTPEPTESPIPTATPTPTISPEVTQTPASQEQIYVLKVESGQSSETVSKNLEELGVIEDAGDFNRYLCDNGYAKYIGVGTYEIEANLSFEQIAKIIARK